VTAADKDDAVTTNGDGFGARPRGVGGIDAGVGDDDVGRLLLCKCCRRGCQQRQREKCGAIQLVLLAGCKGTNL
jgi:hypothetical protein